VILIVESIFLREESNNKRSREKKRRVYHAREIGDKGTKERIEMRID
jgi:hypothetical protein